MVQFEVPPAIVKAAPEDNITDLLEQRVLKTPDLVLFSVPDGGGWRDITASEFRTQVTALAKGGFVAAGIQPGEKVASSPAPRTSGRSSISPCSTPAR